MNRLVTIYISGTMSLSFCPLNKNNSVSLFSKLSSVKCVTSTTAMFAFRINPTAPPSPFPIFVDKFGNAPINLRGTWNWQHSFPQATEIELNLEKPLRVLLLCPKSLPSKGTQSQAIFPQHTIPRATVLLLCLSFSLRDNP